MRSPYNYDVSGNQPTYEENNQISQDAELTDGWRGDKSGYSEDYEWQWIGTYLIDNFQDLNFSMHIQASHNFVTAAMIKNDP